MTFYELKVKLIDFFADIRLYNFGVILWGDSSYQIKGPHMRSLIEVLQPGDVMLRKHNAYLGSMVIPGYWTHAAIYAGENKVIHVRSRGVGTVEEDILTFFRCDNILVLRPKDPDIIPTAITAARKFLALGVQYDYNFNTEQSDTFYCTELVDNCYGYPVRNRKGLKEIIIPDDYLDEPSFEIVWQKG